MTTTRTRSDHDVSDRTTTMTLNSHPTSIHPDELSSAPGPVQLEGRLWSVHDWRTPDGLPPYRDVLTTSELIGQLRAIRDGAETDAARLGAAGMAEELLVACYAQKAIVLLRCGWPGSAAAAMACCGMAAHLIDQENAEEVMVP